MKSKRFIKLTRKTTGTSVLINIAQIKAIYKHCNKDATVVDFGDGENEYEEVLESVEAIENLLYLMEYGK